MNWDEFFESLISYRTLGIGFLVALSSKILKDIAWYRFNYATRDQTITTRNCYDWFEHYLPNTKDELIDYSEGIFDFINKPNMTLQEATLNKYETIFKKLDLKPGMTLLDAGCGSGVWMDFCRARGVTVNGLTLSAEQATVVEKKGLDVDVQDYRIENPKFIGKFDRITVLGSTEHMCSSMGTISQQAARERSIETLTHVWSLLRRYLKPEGRIFVSTLTINDNVTWSLMDYFQAYVMDQHYGGYYPLMKDIQYNIAPQAGLMLTDIQDHTASYHWSSMSEPKHFGYFTVNWKENTWDKISYFFKSTLKNPFQSVFHWLYQGLDTWMWQFGGPTNQPLTENQVAKTPAQLKYFMMTAEPISMAEQNCSLSSVSLFKPLKKLTDPLHNIVMKQHF